MFIAKQEDTEGRFIFNIALLILFSLPLIFFPYTYSSFELPKVLFLYLCSSLLLTGLIISKPHFIKPNLVHILVLIFIVWLIFTSVLGVNFPHSFWGSYFRMQGLISLFAYFIVFICAGIIFKNGHFREKASWAILLSSLTASIIALAQFISFYFLGNSTQLLYSGRIISTSGQPNFLASFLVMSLPFCWYLQLLYKGYKRYLCISIGAVIVFALILTFSRSGILALTVLLFIWGLFHWRLFLGLLTSIIILYAILANLFPLLVFREWSRFQVDLGTYWSAENRQLIAQRSQELVIKRPILGYGVENFILVFPEVVRKDDFGLKDIVVDSSHNLFLDIVVESGVPGLIIFILLLSATLIKGLKNLGTHQHNFTAILMVTIIVFLVSHLFSVLSVVPLTVFFISLGGIAGPAFSINHQYQNRTWTKFTTIALCFVFLTPTLFFIIQNFRADMVFKTASYYEVSDIHKAIKLNNQAISLAPWVRFYKIRRDFLLKQLGY